MKYYPVLLILLLAAMTACSKESDDLLLNETCETYRVGDYYVDDRGNEGVVAVIWRNSTTQQQTAVLVLSLDESAQPWGPMGEQVLLKDTLTSMEKISKSIGLEVCQAMESRGMEHYPAQQWCFRKNGSDAVPYSGCWRLPSFYELRQIFGENGSAVASLNKSVYRYGGTLLDTEHDYWTCTEDINKYIKIGTNTDYDPINRAAYCSPLISSSSNKDNWLKKNIHYVRAVKYILYCD